MNLNVVELGLTEKLRQRVSGGSNNHQHPSNAGIIIKMVRTVYAGAR